MRKADYECGGVKLYLGDCLEILPTLEAGSVDAVITDLPYGTTACKWDTIIPFESMWKQAKRLLKPHGAFVTTASQPFTSALIMSNLAWFKYELIWDKVNLYTGALLANIQPMKRHENVVVFCDGATIFNKQMRMGNPYVRKRKKQCDVGAYATSTYKRIKTVNTGEHNPCSILEIEAGYRSEKGHHPTQKPAALMAYLIRTYTNEGDTVLDFTMGSGSTGVACIQAGRNFIGIEISEEYFASAKHRIETAQAQLTLAL